MAPCTASAARGPVRGAAAESPRIAVEAGRRRPVSRAHLGLILFLALTVLGWAAYQALDPVGMATLAAPSDAPTPTLVPGTGAVVGLSWQDLNGNGSPDPGEPPLPGTVLIITSQDQAVRLTTTADADGLYRFDALAPGFYTLTGIPPSGYELTTPPALTLFVGAGSTLTLNFGARLLPTITPTATSVPAIDVGGAAPAVCGSVIQANNRAGVANVKRYGCFPAWAEDGPELVYRVDLTRSQLLTASLLTTTADLDLFLLTTAYPASCVAAGDTYLTYEAPPGVYYLVVDGYEGATGDFSLRLTCPQEPVQATPTPTFTPTSTPTVTPTFTPGPTPTATMTPMPALAYLPLTLRQPAPTPTATPTPYSPAQQRYTLPGVFWRDIRFVGRTGYAVGGPDWDAAGNATLLKSTDSGQTWTPSTLNTTSWMAGLDCKNADTCWIAGKSGAMRITTDGGTKWEALNKLQSYTGHLVSAGWTGVGDTVLFGGSSGNILRAADGFNVSVLQTGFGSDQTDFACPAAGICYAAASDKGVLFSANNGQTWVLRSAGAAAPYFNSVACTDASTCWIAGASGMIYRTTDGGSTWQRQSADIPAAVSFNRVRMADAQHGYAIGCSSTNPTTGQCSGGGALYRTTDGVHWTAREPFSSSDLMGLYVFSMTDVFIVDWGGTVWHYGG